MICNSCPRQCHTDREQALGYCRSSGAFRIARAALHFWEEPCISGHNGSGTVFFSGCNLRCVYCQNAEISHENKGMEVSEEQLIRIFESLIEQGAENLNLVTPTHYADALLHLFSHWKSPVPVVYNTSGYERVETLQKWEGIADVFLTDLKYISPEKALRYSDAPDYFEVAKAALKEMCRQQPKDFFDERNMMQKGVIIRHLVLPANTNQSLKILDYLKENHPERRLSLMAQYTPCGRLQNTPEINRKITAREYDKVVNYALSCGLENTMIQNLSSSDKNFIPAFDFSGIMC